MKLVRFKPGQKRYAEFQPKAKALKCTWEPDGAIVIDVDSAVFRAQFPQYAGKPGKGGSKLADGVKGLVKAALGIDKPSDDVIAKRLETCAGCEHFKTNKGFKQCALCGCALQAKVRIAGERCPAGKW